MEQLPNLLYRLISPNQKRVKRGGMFHMYILTESEWIEKRKEKIIEIKITNETEQCL
jgi:hypothetical protein